MDVPKPGFKRSLKDRVAKHIVTRRAAPAAVASTVSATFFEHATEHTLAWPRARAFDELKQAVCAAFGHADVSLSDPETRHAIERQVAERRQPEVLTCEPTAGLQHPPPTRGRQCALVPAFGGGSSVLLARARCTGYE